jgi:short-subunit dehydrogenase
VFVHDRRNNNPKQHMSRDLTGSVVAIVGASGGLGSEISKLLHERGAQLILAGPHADRLTSAARGLAPTSVIVPCDLRDPSAGDAIVTAATQIGRLDGVINAAGVVAFGNLVDTSDDVIEELFLTNVLGPLWLMKRLTPLLSVSKGFVANISAVVAESPLAGMAAYSASKAALTAADTALTRELRRSGITVIDARPPHTETELAHHPIAGTPPKLPEGLAPRRVAERIIAAIEAAETDVGAAQFT